MIREVAISRDSFSAGGRYFGGLPPLDKFRYVWTVASLNFDWHNLIINPSNSG